MMFVRVLSTLVFCCCVCGFVQTSGACEELVEKLSVCEQYLCYNSGDVKGEVVSRNVMGKFPGGCKYVEYGRSSVVECVFPEEKLGSIVRKYFLNSNRLDATEIALDGGGLGMYCSILHLEREQDKGPGFNDKFDDMQNSINNEEFNSLFMTEDQVAGIRGALKAVGK